MARYEETYNNEQIRVYRLIDSPIFVYDSAVSCGQPQDVGDVPVEKVQASSLLDVNPDEAFIDVLNP